MEKAYNQLYLLFVAIFFVLLWGFFRTYIVLFPSFKGMVLTDHVHGALMMSWVLMLIVQPLLIRRKLLKWHRIIGKVSYVTMPLLLLSIFFVTKIGYQKDLGSGSRPEAVAGIFLSLPNLVSLGFLYAMAILNKKKAKIHMRYMLGTSLFLIAPGLGRALIMYFHVAFSPAIYYSYGVDLLLALTFLVYDLRRKRLYQPYIIISLVVVLNILCWAFRLSPPLQSAGSRFADVFF
jgi:hypothetical protein